MSVEMSKVCAVCGDKALGYNFNAVTCESCKAFFRRNALVAKEFTCPFNDHCDITVVTRRFCQRCRLSKCVSIGMRKEYIMSTEDKLLKRKKIEQNRAKKRQGNETETGRSKIKREKSLNVCPTAVTETNSLSNLSGGELSQSPVCSPDNICDESLVTPVRRERSESPPMPTVESPASEIVARFTRSSADASKVIAAVMRTPQETVDIMGKVINSPKDAIQLITWLITTPGDALKIISCIMNSPFDALTVFTKFMSSPTDAFEIITKIVRSPADVAQFMQQLMQQPGDALQVMNKFINAPGEALKIINKMMNHSKVDSTTPSTCDNESVQLQTKTNVNTDIGQNPMILSMLDTFQIDSPRSSPPTYSIPPNVNSDNIVKPPIIDSVDMYENDFTRNLIQEVESVVIQPNSLESVLCEAIKLEYDTYNSLSPMTPMSSTSTSRELKDNEQAKLNELIIANKALYAPVDEDLSSLISDDCKIKTNHNHQDPQLIRLINLTAVAIRRLIKMSKKISAFKNMCQEDQVALLKGGCTEMMILRSVMQYDSDRDTWKIPHSTESMSNIKADVLKLAKGNVYEEHENFIRTFETKWRADENIVLILCGITLFTPDRPKTVHSDVIKLEQNSYYYLLRRYLESVYPGCEAKSTFLKLITKVKELRKLNEAVISVYLNVNPIQVEPLLREIFDLKTH